MRMCVVVLLALLLGGCSVLYIAKNKVIAFVDVNVIPMDEERVLENQTVIVHDGVIEKIGNSSEVDVPDSALVIDGHGKYLMPGLVDMHVHISQVIENRRGVREESAAKKGNSVKVTFLVDSTAMV